MDTLTLRLVPAVFSASTFGLWSFEVFSLFFFHPSLQLLQWF